jgi:uncharacterized protein
LGHTIEAIMDAPLALPTIPVTAAASAEKARPVLDRIVVLDILRGIALIGMFIVHFNLYESTPDGVEPGRVAAFVEHFIGLFIEERFWGIFGMLFGIGFAVQLTRAEARGEPFVARYLRRLAALAVFGIISEGVFGYNVLFGYALWGVPLLLVRKWPVKALVVLLILCASSRQLYMVGKIAAASGRPDGVAQYFATEDANWATFKAARDSFHAAEQSSSWRPVVAARMKFMPTFHRQWSVFPNLSFVLFLMGLIAWRLGVFTHPEKHKRLIASLAVAGAVLWAMSVWVMPIGRPSEWPPTRDPVLNTILAIARGSGFALVRSQWLTWTYIGIVLLLVAHNRVWLQRLAPIGWAGRMALTNYLMQVVLLDVLFTPHGFGLKVPALLVFPGAIALFAAQVAMSRWWLARFRLGPMEWVWRCVTNWKMMPLRIEGLSAVPQLGIEARG